MAVSGLHAAVSRHPVGQELRDVLEEGVVLAQQLLQVVVSAVLHPQRFRAHGYGRRQEQLLSIPEGHYFVLDTVYDEDWTVCVLDTIDVGEHVVR